MTFKLVKSLSDVWRVIEKPISVLDYTHFLLFFPALSSDRLTVIADLWTIGKQRSRAKYLEPAGTGILVEC